MEGAEECSFYARSPLEKVKEFCGAEDQAPRKKFAQKMLRKACRKLIYEKSKHYHKEYRQMYRTEIRMARIPKKAANFYVPVEPKLAFVIRIKGVNGVSRCQMSRRCCSFFTFTRYSISPSLSSARLWLTHWGLWNHICMGVPKPEVSKRIDQQAWLWQNQQKMNCPYR